MQGRTHGHLDGFQIETATLAAVVEDDAQELIYFARDFLLDRFGRFFSCGDSASGSGGRSWQICALTSTNSLCSDCSLRNSAISRSALRIAAWSGKHSVTVLPTTL